MIRSLQKQAMRGISLRSARAACQGADAPVDPPDMSADAGRERIVSAATVTEPSAARPASKASRSGSEKRRTSVAMSLRMSPADRERIRVAAAERGMGGSTLLRRTMLSLLNDGTPALPRRRRQPVADPAALRRILSELGRIGGNVNQMSRRVNTSFKSGGCGTPKVQWMQRIHGELEAMRGALVEALKR